MSMQDDDEMSARTNQDTSLCRVCLTMNHCNQCIFRRNWNDPDSTDTSELLSKKLQLCGGVEVQEDDGLPSSICTKCEKKINIAYELREQCQKADKELRKLYGITLSTNVISNFILTKDQCCQTEQSFNLGTIKLEDNKELNMDNRDNIEKNIFMTESKNIMKHEQPDTFNQTENILVDNVPDLDCVNKCKQHDKIIIKEVHRTRRLTMFKRVTSMENLKNHKERQRRYIKKSASVKRDINNSEYQTNMKNIDKKDTMSEFELRYKCPKCDRFYSSKRSLDKHTLTHDDKEFKCDNCDKQFFCLDKLHKHFNLHKTKEKSEPVFCRICNKRFRKTDTMVRHLNVHKRANPKEVFSILKEIRDKRKLENNIEYSEMSLHVIVNKDEEIVHEEKSQSVKDSMRELRKRNAKNEQRDSLNSDSSNDKFMSFDDTLLFDCRYCSKHFTNEKSLQRHQSVHKKFICSVCNMKFFRQDRLKSHMDRYGHDESKTCSEPQKPPDDKSAIKLINSWIREELDSDNEGKGFPCKICGKSYDTKKSLLKHQMKIHGGQDEYCANCGASSVCICADKDKDQEKNNEKLKLYTCEECNKSFEKEIKLQRHLRIHERAKEQQDTNFKRFLCHICSKTFRQNTGLMFHMRTHTGYKPHVCKYCGRGFTSNSNCINHERTHTGDRPFVCQYCSAAFAKSCTLKAHITTHTGEANYHCKTCGKSFRRLKYLKEHRFTHTGEKPYACKICGTAYSHSGSLFVHEKKCKAQYSNYQSETVQNAQQQTIYCGQSPQTTISGGISSVTSPSSVIAPIIMTTLPQAHLNVINSTLNVQTNKDYMDDIQRINAHETSTATTVVSSGLQSNNDISEMSSPVRSFAIIGQMFHT